MRLEPHFKDGTQIVGKWNKHKYRIEHHIGEGSNGKVYLVRKGMHSYAMKMGFSVHDHQSEVNALKELEFSDKSRPYLIDVDDFQDQDLDYPFYVMKYVKGLCISEYIRQKGQDWIYLIGRNLLKRLHHIHIQGWVFGDLKPDNVMVSKYGQVDLIDYGGVSARGHSVKQFTEVYDRGFWQAGLRTADESYDLFSFAILCIHCLEPKLAIPELPQNRDIDYLLEVIDKNSTFHPLRPFLIKAIRGQYLTSKQAYQEWSHLTHRTHKKVPANPHNSWLRPAFFASAVGLASTIYFIVQ